VVDAFRIWQVKSPRRLDDAVEEFCGRQRGTSHRALVDVEDALEALAGQRERWPDLPTSVAALHDLCFPDQLDPDGKIIWVKGEAVFNIGKHKGRRLRDVPRDYFSWMQRDNFSPFIKAIAKEAEQGRFPSRV
jgi:DNA polymerase III subunit epsilon